MKTTNIITRLSLLLALSFFTISATSNTTPSNTVTPSAEKSIATYFKFPKVLIPYRDAGSNKPVKVEVIFTTDKNGKVNYAYAKTRDQRLKKEIEKQFSTFELSQIKHDVVHSVVLNFRYLDAEM